MPQTVTNWLKESDHLNVMTLTQSVSTCELNLMDFEKLPLSHTHKSVFCVDVLSVLLGRSKGFYKLNVFG